jgi:hypothetical protein
MEQPSTTATMPEPTTTATPSQAAAQTTPVASPTPSDAGQSGTAAPVEETLGNIDPKTLSPELKQKYDSMLVDYKKKTAELADKRKDYESVSEKAKLVDMITSDPEFVTWWNNKYSSGQAQPQAPTYVDPALKQEVDTLKASLLLKDFKAQHPDFDDLDKDSLITGYVQLNPPKSEREWSKTLEKAYAYASDLRNRWKEEGKKEGLTRVEEKAKQSTLPPSSTSPNTFQGDTKKLSVAEAIDMAKRGVKIDPSRW